MDAVVEVADGYRHELEQTMQRLRERGEALGQTAPQMIEETKSQIEPQTQELIAAVQDTSDVSPAPKPVIEVFAWATVMVLSANIGIFLGSYILGPLLSVFLGKTGAALLAFIAVPGYAHYSITQKSGESDSNIRFEVLSLAIAQGILTGFVIDSLYLSNIPFAVFTPAIITVAFPAVAQSSGGNRVTLLGGTIGAAVIFNFAVGLVTGGLSFTYFLLTLTYGGIAAVVMQLVLKNLKDEAKGHIYQNALSCGFVIAKGMFFLLFGSYDRESG